MKERPILFSTPMVQAILEGRKTQTRRIIKPQPILHDFGIGGIEYAFVGKQINIGSAVGVKVFNQKGNSAFFKHPYGKVGDRLWVRETWKPVERASDSVDGILFKADNVFQPIENSIESANKWIDVYNNGKNNHQWKPSIFMPRWASRINLEITNIRVERLKDISEEDAKAEGAYFTDYGRKCFHNPLCNELNRENHAQKAGWSMVKTLSSDDCLATPKFAFQNLWRKINGEQSWNENPFVWVIEFKKV